eukprot:NODE_834_length_3613_cov_0.384178.p2 type:complete len:203 gc:universal NODE_834_length_3613_cov_0.384178:2400-1792(-)
MVLLVKSRTKYFLAQRKLYNDQRKLQLKSLRHKLEHKIPVKWDMQTECFYCDKKFNLLNRRHHCRLCGKSIDEDCLRELEREKICKQCFILLTNEAIEVDDPMSPIFENVELLKRQLIEILPYFNGLIMELSSANENERSAIHKQATDLKRQLVVVLEGIQNNINSLKDIPAHGDYKRCIDNYLKSIQLFMQSFTGTLRTFK